MTKEEATRLLPRVKLAYGTANFTRDSYTACEWFETVEKALEQEPKTGHWVCWYETNEYKKYTEHIPHCKCSECNKEYDSHSAQFIKYCPNCGAKMVKPQESEEAWNT